MAPGDGLSPRASAPSVGAVGVRRVRRRAAERMGEALKNCKVPSNALHAPHYNACTRTQAYGAFVPGVMLGSQFVAQVGVCLQKSCSSTVLHVLQPLIQFNVG